MGSSDFLRPALTEDRSMFLMFLRARRFRPIDAAVLLAVCFEAKRDLFGDEILIHRITWDDVRYLICVFTSLYGSASNNCWCVDGLYSSQTKSKPFSDRVRISSFRHMIKRAEVSSLFVCRNLTFPTTTPGLSLVVCGTPNRLLTETYRFSETEWCLLPITEGRGNHLHFNSFDSCRFFRFMLCLSISSARIFFVTTLSGTK